MGLGACHRCASGTKLAFHVDFRPQIHRLRIFCGGQARADDVMVDLNGHEAGNGGHSQGTPTTCHAFLYSDTGGLATQMCRTESTVSRETSCGGEHLGIRDLLEVYYKFHQHLAYASQCSFAENLA